MAVLVESDDRPLASWPPSESETEGIVWTLADLEQLVATCLGELRARPGVRDQAYSRALALLDDEAACGEAYRIASIGFARDLLAGLVVELSANLPTLGRLIRRLETAAEMSGLELGRELVRSPELLRLPATVAVDVVLKLLLAFTEGDGVSLWRLSSAALPEPIASVGNDHQIDPRTRWLAQDLLAGQPVDLPGDPDTAGVRIECPHGSAALICHGSCVSATRPVLLLEAATPVLTAALMQDERLGSSGPTGDGPDRETDQAGAAERRLARVRFDLHDGPQQDLMLLAEDLRLFRSQLDSLLTLDESRGCVMGRFDDLEARLIAVDGDLRRISVFAESPFLQDESFPDALAQLTDAFARQTGIQPQIDLQGDFDDLTDSQHITLLGLIREALGNVRQHADAEHVTISLSSSVNGVEATVTDDGRGFEPDTMLVEAARQGHLGLVGMHERARMLGGATRIDSRLGGPTVILVSLPPAPVAAPRRVR